MEFFYLLQFVSTVSEGFHRLGETLLRLLEGGWINALRAMRQEYDA